MRPLDSPPRGRVVPRAVLRRLALVSVQGEELQNLCDGLVPVLDLIRQDPKLAPNAELLDLAMQAAAAVARDIARMTDVLRDGLQPPGLDTRLPSPPVRKLET